MTGIWSWHTRTWVEHGTLHTSQSCGLGWYALLVVAVIVVCALMAWSER